MEAMKAASTAKWVEEMLASGQGSFYEYDGDAKTGVFNVKKRGIEPIEKHPSFIFLKEEKIWAK